MKESVSLSLTSSAASSTILVMFGLVSVIVLGNKKKQGTSQENGGIK